MPADIADDILHPVTIPDQETNSLQIINVLISLARTISSKLVDRPDIRPEIRSVPIHVKQINHIQVIPMIRKRIKGVLPMIGAVQHSLALLFPILLFMVVIVQLGCHALRLIFIGRISPVITALIPIHFHTIGFLSCDPGQSDGSLNENIINIFHYHRIIRYHRIRSSHIFITDCLTIFMTG